MEQRRGVSAEGLAHRGGERGTPSLRASERGAKASPEVGGGVWERAWV